MAGVHSPLLRRIFLKAKTPKEKKVSFINTEHQKKKKFHLLTQKTMKITFVKSPTAVHKLAYSAGETADLPSKLATNLVKDGYAIGTELEDKPVAKMSKGELIDYAESNAIELTPGLNKGQILAVITESEAPQQ